MNKALKSYSDEELYYLLLKDKKTAAVAFDELYSRLSTKLFTYCKRVMMDDALAEDIFQETFLKFYESTNAERNMTNVSAFIFRIARNLCINEKQKKYHSFVELEETSAITDADSYEAREKSVIVENALASLPDKFREVLVLKEYLGFSYQEIADLMSITLPSVRIQIYRAKQKMRELLQPYMEDPNRRQIE
jgi:RNA polymerase sigma-70 factor (ECF subfamily)